MSHPAESHQPDPPPGSDRWLDLAVLSLVLSVAALGRVGWPGVHSFSYDEARVSQIALEMARLGRVPTVGIQSSVGVPNAPLSVWLYALPYALSPDPLFASLATGVANVAAVGGLWWLVRREWGRAASLAAGLLYAASPYAAFYSRAVWSQDLLGPLAVAWAAAAVHGVARRRGWALAACVLLAGLAPQVHYAGAALLIPTAFLVVRHRLWRRWGAILAGATPAALAAVPLVLALGRSGAVGRLLDAMGPRGTESPLAGSLRFLEMALGRGWEWFLLGEGWSWKAPGPLILTAGQALIGVLLLIGAASLARDLTRRRAPMSSGGVLAELVPLWAASAPLLFGGHLTPAYHQYQLASLPAAFALAGYAARAREGATGHPTWRGVATAAALAAIVPQVVSFTLGLNIVAGRLTPGGIGTPLVYPRAAVGALRDGGEIVVHAHGDEAQFVGDVAGFEVLLWGYPHRVVDGRWALLLPPASSGAVPHLLFTFDDLPACEVAGALGLGQGRRDHPRRVGEPPYVSYTPSAPRGENWGTVSPARLANGAELRAWRAERRGEALRVYTLWAIVGEPGPGRYHQFHHLRTGAEGEPAAIVDVPVSSRAWRAGDTLIVWADLPAAEVPAWVEVGMYTWPDVARTPVLGRGGDPLAPIRLGPISPS